MAASSGFVTSRFITVQEAGDTIALNFNVIQFGAGKMQAAYKAVSSRAVELSPPFWQLGFSTT